jgi:CHAD domain-containing protein
MTHITPAAPLWLAARAILAERGNDLLQRWDRTKKSFSLDDIHDLRVSSRRLREALALFAPCFPNKKMGRINSRIKRLTNILGTMRNTDEALLYFGPLVSILPAAAASALQQIVTGLEAERGRELKALKQRLKALNPSALKGLFAQTYDQPLVFSNKVDQFMSIVLYLQDKIAEREQAVHDLLPGACQEGEIAAQHRLRIAVKRFRYRFEMTAPFIGPAFQELLATLKRYQELLGQMHDLDVFFELLAKRIADPSALEPIQARITSRRHELFTNFLTELTADPLDLVGARIREHL